MPQVIDRLIAAGLDSIPGGGAEILVDRVRQLLHCYGKATADEWLDVMRHAHRAGLRTTATMMYGTVETDEERLEHLLRLRDLQDETGGFTAFITWSYQPEHTELAGVEATGVDYLRTLAIARIVLDNFDNLQASWVTQGGKVGQLSLAYGANDMGSVMIEENVVRAAGASYCMDEVEIVGNIEDAGFAAKRRNMHYDILGDPIFREREVPRMLELATARRSRRHAACPRSSSLPGAQPRGQSRSIAGRRDCRIAGRIQQIFADAPLHGCLGAADRAPPIRDGWVAVDGGRIVGRGAAAELSEPAASRRRSGPGRAAARARQRAHAPRALVPARRGAAGRQLRRRGFAASWRPGAGDPTRAPRRSWTRSTRQSRRRSRPAPPSSATSATRS